MLRFYNYRGVAQTGSALEWGSRGRWFKSSRPDFQMFYHFFKFSHEVTNFKKHVVLLFNKIKLVISAIKLEISVHEALKIFKEIYIILY